MYIIANNAESNTTDQWNPDFHLSALVVEKPTHFPIPSDSSTVVKSKKQNVRKELIGDLYVIYLKNVNKDYQIKNKKRYYRYVRLHYPTALSKREDYNSHKDEFRSAKLPEHQRFLTPIKSTDFLWWGRFSHLKGEDGNECLRTVISEAKDRENRKQDVALYIMGSCGKLST